MTSSIDSLSLLRRGIFVLFIVIVILFLRSTHHHPFPFDLFPPPLSNQSCTSGGFPAGRTIFSNIAARTFSRDSPMPSAR